MKSKPYLDAVRRLLRTERTLFLAVQTGDIAKFQRNESFRAANVHAIRKIGGLR